MGVFINTYKSSLSHTDQVISLFHTCFPNHGQQLESRHLLTPPSTVSLPMEPDGRVTVHGQHSDKFPIWSI